MPTIFVKDALRMSVEAASGGQMTVLYDDKGFPSYMVIIPKFNVEDIDPKYGTGVHPAFIVNGVQKPEIFIGAYQAKIYDNRACSIPHVDPTVNINFDNSKAACTNKGAGWHLMTNWEWAAVALWCLKNGFQPRGNTNGYVWVDVVNIDDAQVGGYIVPDFEGYGKAIRKHERKLYADYIIGRIININRDAHQVRILFIPR